MAQRDIQALLNRGMLERDEGGGRSNGYRLGQGSGRPFPGYLFRPNTAPRLRFPEVSIIDRSH